MAKRRIKLGKYFIESSIVAFGVILGILLSNWNSERKANQDVKKTLQYIVVELDSNISLLRKSYKYHSTLNQEIDSLYKVLPDDLYNRNWISNEGFKLSEIRSWRGIGTSNPETILYESAILSGSFQQLNINTTRTIASVYERLKVYEKLSETALNKLIDLNSQSKVVDLFYIFDIMREDITGFEQVLLIELEKAKSDLEIIISENSFKK